MKMRNMALAGLVGGAILMGADALAVSAALPFAKKSVIYFGWDTLEATTAEVWEGRDQFAATGFDGICMPLTGKLPNGGQLRGRLPMTRIRFTREQFAESIGQIREMTKLPGLSGSYLMVYWMSSPRMDWRDDEAWATFAANMRFLAEVAKETGLKGLFVDHEDYTGKPLFTWRKDDDPPYDETLRLARRRGREMMAAVAEGFPGGQIINDRLLMQNIDCARSQQPVETLRGRRDLWSAFVNGVLEAKPDGFGFDDGCEYGYGAMTEKDYQALKYQSLMLCLPFLDSGLRAKFTTSTKVCFGKWLDRWFRKQDLPFVPGRFTESMWAAGVGCDGTYWVYGEHSPIIRWSRKAHPRVDYGTVWSERIPDFATILRSSVGDYSLLRARAESGELANLVSNSACESKDGRFPAPFMKYTESKVPQEGMFSWDGAVGCAAPGSLKLAGRGNVLVQCGGLKAYDRIYVRFAAKGENPVGNVVWRSKGAYEWYLDYQYLMRPVRIDENGWKHYEVAMCVPDKNRQQGSGDEASAPVRNDVDSVGIIFGGSLGPESPIWFDDISIYKW